jgi:hypothetical protein
MPSLVYIAQIPRSSEELAQGLQSAGLHVKSFAPGEITKDECLLVMTSDAVLANQRSADAATRGGHKADTGQEVESATLPSKMSAKTVSPSHPAPSLPADHRSRVSPAQTSAASCGKAARPDKRRRVLSVPRYSLLWQTVAIATSMLLFAAIRPSTIDVTTRGTDQSTRFAADSEEPTQSASGRQSVTTSRASKLLVTPSSTVVTKTAGEQRYQSDHGFVAENFTNHFDPQAHSIVTLQSSERNARASVKPKRIVVVN